MAENPAEDFMSTHKFKNIIFEKKDGHIALITINRPKVLNAINKETMQELMSCVEILKNSDDIRVVVITGAGDKAFVAGADISQFPKMNENEAIEFATYGQSVFSKLEELKQPVIAAVNGYALGGGCELVLACDFIYASENAKLGQPEVSLGILPGYGGTQRLSRLVGKAMAKELIYSGKVISAQEALRIRLVNKVFAQKDLLLETIKTANLIASKAPIAVAESKKAIEQGYDILLKEALAVECQGFSKTFGTQDQKEGAKAFLEKRKPHFIGK
jgi:enoyl-CoA hydratase